MLRRLCAGAAAGGGVGGGEPVELIDWDGIFAFVIHATGWTWEQVEHQLDLHRLYALTRHWRQHPPVHQLVAAYLQYEPPAPMVMVNPDEEVTGELADLLGSVPLRKVKPIDDSAWRASQAERESEQME